jgi:hypothetical protein
MQSHPELPLWSGLAKHQPRVDCVSCRPPVGARKQARKASGASGPLPSPSPVGKTGSSPKPDRKTGHPGGELPGVPPALSARLLPILRRAGYVVPGDPAWRSPAELQAWFDRPRKELDGRSWAQIHVPFTLEGRMRFAHAMDQIDRETVEVPA